MKGLTRQISIAVSGVSLMYANLFMRYGHAASETLGNLVKQSKSLTLGEVVTQAALDGRVALPLVAFTSHIIWLPMLLAVAAFTVYQALPAKRHDPRLDVLGLPMTMAFVSGAIIANSMLIAGIVAVGVLIASRFIAFYALLQVDSAQASGSTQVNAYVTTTPDISFKLLVYGPLLLFFGWVTLIVVDSTSTLLMRLWYMPF
ncbi:MAG: hypothetical protein AAF708_13935 [Deinococcota bacterium]